MGFIYKITSPKNRIYIGQTIDIEERFLKYKGYRCKKQPRLYNSFIKYTVDNHIFEIIEGCEIEDLNIRERYWQEFYDVLSKKGLNCLLTKSNNRSGKMSKESKLKMSNSHKGKIVSKETRLKISLGSTKSKEVINIQTGEIFRSCTELCNLIGVNVKTLSKKLSGNRRNTTIYKYV